MKNKILFVFLVIVTFLYFSHANYVFADFPEVNGVACPSSSKNINGVCWVTGADGKLLSTVEPLVAICITHGMAGSIGQENIPVGTYVKFITQRFTGSSGEVGLISDGGIELNNVNDSCPNTNSNLICIGSYPHNCYIDNVFNNGYNNVFNNHYNNEFNNHFNNGFNNHYNNGYKNGLNNGYNNGYNNHFNNNYNNGFIAE